MYTSVNTGVIVQHTSHFIMPLELCKKFFYTAKLLASRPCLPPSHALLGEYPDQEASASRMCPCGRGRKDAVWPQQGRGKGGESAAPATAVADTAGKQDGAASHTPQDRVLLRECAHETKVVIGHRMKG